MASAETQGQGTDLESIAKSLISAPPTKDQEWDTRLSLSLIETTLKQVVSNRMFPLGMRREPGPNGEKLIVTQMIHYDPGEGPITVDEALSAKMTLTINSQGLPERVLMEHRSVNPNSPNIDILPPDVESVYIWKQYGERVENGKRVAKPYWGLIDASDSVIVEGRHIMLSHSTYDREIIDEGGVAVMRRTGIPGGSFSSASWTKELAQAGEMAYTSSLAPGLGKVVDLAKAAEDMRQLEENHPPFIIVQDLADGVKRIVLPSASLGTLNMAERIYDSRNRLISDTSCAISLNPWLPEFAEYITRMSRTITTYEYNDQNRLTKSTVIEPHPWTTLETYVRDGFGIKHPIPHLFTEVATPKINYTQDGHEQQIRIEDDIEDRDKVDGIVFTRTVENTVGMPDTATKTVQTKIRFRLRVNGGNTEFVSGEFVQISEPK